MILVAVLLLIGVYAFTPRPDVIIQATSYSSSGCAAGSTSQNVTATFKLFNQGPADGIVSVSLLVDGSSVASRDYTVPSQGTVPGTIQAMLHDCSDHRYALSMSYEKPPA